MWRSYLVIGFRALVGSRTYAFVNIVGLAVGLAACLMIYLYARSERSYDAWLPNAENVYQLQTRHKSRQTGEESESRLAPYVAAFKVARTNPIHALRYE